MDVRPVPSEATQERGGRGRLATHIDHQHHRPAGQRRNVGGRSGAVHRAVEQPHHAFAEDEFRAVLNRPQQARDRRRPHRPGIEVRAIPPARRGVKSGVDVIGPDLEGRHRHPVAAEAPQQRQGDGRLSAARGGRRNDEAGPGRHRRPVCGRG